MRAVIPLFGLALSACGSGANHVGGGAEQRPSAETPQPSAQPYTMLAQSAANLPPCAPPNEGQLAYLKTEAQFQVCSGGAWSVIEIRGERGEKGEQGDPGKDGDNNRIQTVVYCSEFLGETLVRFAYDAAIMTSGDVIASAMIMTASGGANAVVFYAAGSSDSKTAPVNVASDVGGIANGGFFAIEVDREQKVAKIEYTDADFGDSPQTWASTECTLYEY